MGYPKKTGLDKMHRGWRRNKSVRKRNEKDGGVRQMIFGILKGLACGVSVIGCYPLVPAYFTTLFRTGKRSCLCFYVHRNDSVYAADHDGKME